MKSAKPGEWIAVLGGWSEQQFTDEERGFPREELDAIAPNNPVVLQSVYNHSFLNSAALKAAGIDDKTANPPGGRIEKDATGAPTGMVRDPGGVAFVAAKIPHASAEAWLANTRKLVTYLNSLGVTAWSDLGGRGMSERHYAPYRHLAERGELERRACSGSPSASRRRPSRWTRSMAEVPQLKPFQGNDYFDHIGWGEFDLRPGDHQHHARRRAGESAGAGAGRAGSPRRWRSRASISTRTSRWQTAIDAFLDQYEAVNKTHPIKTLRWVYSHLDQVTEAQLDRMKRLGMSAQLHSRPLIQGCLMHRVHGDKAWDMPPFRRVQDSGIHWGLGSDATAVTPSNPFYTLSFAVTGKMIGGRHVNRQTITREEALIAHTRSNAYFLFQEGNLGSLARGKVRRPAGARPRLPDGAGGRDQGHQAGDDHGGREGGVGGEPMTEGETKHFAKCISAEGHEATSIRARRTSGFRPRC